MIVPRLYGRLGNQCFQIAAAIAHAKKVQTEWCAPIRTENHKIWPHYFLHQLHPKRTTRYGTIDIWTEDDSQEYLPIPAHKSLTLNGYFQSEKYWPSYEEKEEIGNALGFHCKKQDYIAVHVRRGDYVSQFSDKHPPLLLEYYERAIDRFIVEGHDNYRVYSDDMTWCRQHFSRAGLHFSYSNISDPLTDMRDMYNASGFIIANSSFSLFPALLRLDNPVTIAPAEDRWYGPLNSHLSTKDLMPDRFIKI